MIRAQNTQPPIALASDPNDVDGDGLPAAWEAANGLDDNDPSDALRDDDGDGLSNGGEFLAGTDPQDPDSLLRLGEIILAPGGGVTLRWPSVAGKTYRVTYSPDLENWFGYGPLGDVLADGTTSEFIDPGSTPPVRRFYRIALVP